MKRLRRKRSSDNTKPAISISLPQPITPAAETPLYAKFATAQKPPHGTKPIVSGPMALSTKQSFHSGTRPTHERRTSESRPRTLSTRQDESPKRLSSSPPKPSSRKLKEPSTMLAPPTPPALRTSNSQDETRSESTVPSTRHSRSHNIITPQSGPSREGSYGVPYPQSPASPEISQRQVSHSSRLLTTRDVHVPDVLPTTPQKSRLHQQSAMAVGTGADDREYDPFRTSIFVSPVGLTPTKNTSNVPPIPSRVVSETGVSSGSYAAATDFDYSEDHPPPLPSKALPSPPVASPKPSSALGPSLTTSPGDSRKKYSPLAAFGGAIAQGHASHSISTASVVSSRTQTDQVSSTFFIPFGLLLSSFFELRALLHHGQNTRDYSHSYQQLPWALSAFLSYIYNSHPSSRYGHSVHSVICTYLTWMGMGSIGNV